MLAEIFLSEIFKIVKLFFSNSFLLFRNPLVANNLQINITGCAFLFYIIKV